jgi:hypothetical protein
MLSGGQVAYQIDAGTLTLTAGANSLQFTAS